MRKVLFTSIRRARSTIAMPLSCGVSTNRFELGFRKFLKRIGVVNAIPLRWPEARNAWPARSARRSGSSSSSRFANPCGCTEPTASS